LPFLYRSDDSHNIHQWVTEAISQVGLTHRSGHKPAELSGGEMQRVAIARALAVKPKLILADEPTGNLDRQTGEEIMEIFNGLHQNGGTIILVTHDQKVARYADLRATLLDGRFA
jgi:ABC-type lipoprotein export system ATPase subunit